MAKLDPFAFRCEDDLMIACDRSAAKRSEADMAFDPGSRDPVPPAVCQFRQIGAPALRSGRPEQQSGTGGGIRAPSFL